MSDELVWVKLDITTGTLGPVAIFANYKQARDSGASPIAEYSRQWATDFIRRAVFVRDNWTCTHCGDEISWDGPNRGHLHERLFRGNGGEISVANSTTLCYTCHMADPVAGHGKRKPQWGTRA